MIVQKLMKLPFYQCLTPAIRHYIAERVIVESYLPMERINVSDPQKLDFMYVDSGCIEFMLENLFSKSCLGGQAKRTSSFSVSGRDTVPASGARTFKGSSYFMLKAGMHIENSDLRVMDENVPVSQSNRINRLLNTSNRSQANTFLRLATQRNDQSNESS